MKKIIRKVKLKTWIGLGLITVLLPIIFLALFKPLSAEAVWYDDTFLYRQKFSFTHNADIASERSITFSLDTAEIIAARGMQSDCDDLRFTNINGKPLRYQLTGTCDNAATTYEVVFPTINNGTNVGYIYYGNSVIGTDSEDVSAVTALTPSGGDPSITTRTNEEKGSSPAGYWRFNEGVDNTCPGGTNDICDSTSNGNDGIRSGAAWKTSDLCLTGNCLFFDGVNDYAQLTDDSILHMTESKSMSFSSWVRPTSFASTADIIRYDDCDVTDGDATCTRNLYIVRVLTSGQINFAFGPSSGLTSISTSLTPLTLNTWNHIEAVRDVGADTAYIYINGQLMASGTDVTTGSWETTGQYPIVGKYDSASDEFFTGFIDELKIYNYARSAAQVNADFQKSASTEGTAARLGASNQSFLSNGLTAYWKLDETSGAASDSSGNSQTLTDASSTTFAGGKFGNGADLELGSTDYQYIADNATLSITGSLTLSAWIKPETVTAGTYNILAKWDGANESYRLMQNADEIRIEIDSSGNYVETTSSNLAAATWYHVVGVYDSSSATAKVYINGYEATSSTTGTIPSSIGDDGGRFHIGAEDSTTSATGYYDGLVDEVRIYKRALSNTEVNQLYNFATVPVGYWNFDENTGTSLADRSGNGNSSSGFNDSPTWQPGKLGGALDFDGDAGTDYVNIPSSANYQNTNEFSIMGWINWDKSTDTVEHIASYYDTDNSDQGFVFGSHFMTNPGLRLFNGTGTTSDTQVQLTSFPSTGAWHHFAAVFKSGSYVKLYLDGVEQATTIDASPGYAVTYGFDVTPSLRIGDRSDSAGSLHAFHGKVDEFRLYNYVRTPGQIVEDMNGGHPLGGSPLASQYGFYSFDEQQGETTNNKGVGGTGVNGLKGGSASTGEADDPTWKTGTTCKVSGCLDFDGGDYTDHGTSFTANGEFTISAWVNLDSNSIADYIRPVLAKGTFGADGEGDITLGLQPPGSPQTGTGRWYILADTTSARSFAISDASATTGSWVHVAGTWDGTTLRIYENGKLRGSTALSGTLTNSSDSTFIGAYPNDVANTGIDGRIDEVKYYTGALTQDQILVDMNMGSAVNFSVGQNEASLLSDGVGTIPVRNFPLDDGTGTTAIDISTNSSSGTLNSGMSSTNWVPGKHGYGLNFDGVNDNVSFTSFAATAVSYSAWIKATGNFTVFSRIVSTPSFDFYFDSSNNSLGVTTGHATPGVWNSPANSLTDNSTTWYHVEITYNSASLTNDPLIYINGVSQTVTETTNPVGSLTPNTGTGYIGNRSALDRTFVGVIDNVVLYDYIRTPAQVAYDYNRGGPLTWYKFDECSGATANDSGLGTNTGTITPATLGNTAVGDCLSGTSTDMWYNGATGRYNSALDFDGTDDLVTTADSASLDLTTMTASAWVKQSAADSGGIISKGTGLTSNYLLQTWEDQQVYFSIYDGEQRQVSSGSVTYPLNEWFHIAGSYDGATLKVYLNGKLVGSSSIATTPTVNASALVIGTDGGGSHFTDGQIDDVRIYNYALSESQIKIVMNNASTARFGPSQGQP